MASKSGLTFPDTKALIKDMEAMGPTVSERAAVSGVRKAAGELRRSMRGKMPRRKGNLRKSITYKRIRKNVPRGEVLFFVGLRTRQYYSTLWRGRNGPRPAAAVIDGNPIQEAIDSYGSTALKTITSETRKALYREAGKVHAREKLRRKR